MLDYQKNSFNADIYLSYSWRYKHNQIERRHEELRHQRQFFQNLDNFHIYVFFINGKNVLLVTFSKYTLSKFYSHCNQNCKFFYLYRLESVFWKKIYYEISVLFSLSWHFECTAIAKNHFLHVRFRLAQNKQ